MTPEFCMIRMQIGGSAVVFAPFHEAVVAREHVEPPAKRFYPMLFCFADEFFINRHDRVFRAAVVAQDFQANAVHHRHIAAVQDPQMRRIAAGHVSFQQRFVALVLGRILAE